MKTFEPQVVHAPRGSQRSCKGWHQEAALRMLMNNLDPDVAERPQDLVVYGGTGKAARSWEAFHAIVRSLRELADDETLLVQSGKPVGIAKTHPEAPRVLIANSLLVPAWATWDEFRRLEGMGLTMYGQMTAGSWIYIGTQGILQGTYETFAEASRQHFGGTLRGRWTLTAGLGGMGGAQPLAVTMNEGVCLAVEVDPARVARRLETRYLDKSTRSLEEALLWVERAVTKGEPPVRRSRRPKTSRPPSSVRSAPPSPRSSTSRPIPRRSPRASRSASCASRRWPNSTSVAAGPPNETCAGPCSPL